MQKSDDETVRFAFRCPRWLWEWFRAYAKGQGRSANEQLIQELKQRMVAESGEPRSDR